MFSLLPAAQLPLSLTPAGPTSYIRVFAPDLHQTPFVQPHSPKHPSRCQRLQAVIAWWWFSNLMRAALPLEPFVTFRSRLRLAFQRLRVVSAEEAAICEQMQE